MATIFDKDMHHGAALTQIAEHEEFTSINRVVLDHTRAHSAFDVNGEVGIFLKYSTTPTPNGEYQFSFKEDNLEDFDALKEDQGDAYAVLIINDDVRGNKVICCISHSQLFSLKRARDAKNTELGKAEVAGVNIHVRIRRNKPFSVNVKQPGTGGKRIWHYEVPMNAFPDKIFR